MLTEDLTTFFNVSELGESVTYEGSSITALVESVVYESMLDDRTIQYTKELWCKESDITVPVSGQKVTLDDQSFIVGPVRNQSGVVVISLGYLTS